MLVFRVSPMPKPVSCWRGGSRARNTAGSKVHSQVLQQCLKDLDRAYTNSSLVVRLHRSTARSFSPIASAIRRASSWMDARSTLPMIGWVEFWHSRDIEGTVKNVTVSRQGQHWFVAFQVEMDVPDPVHPATADVGIDLGIATFAAFSDGTLHPPLNAYRHAATEESPHAAASWRAW